MNKTALFSGRFDPPNTGHWLTVLDLVWEYCYVDVIVLQPGTRFYRKRDACTTTEAIQIFNHVFDRVIPPIFRNRIRVYGNRDHFGYITKRQFLALLKQHDLKPEDCEYIAGNTEVLDHVESLDIMPCRQIRRVNIKGLKLDQYLFESTKIRARMKRRKSTLGQEYNIG